MWVVDHVLSGWDSNNALPSGSGLFYQIVERYSQHVIANVFFGHTHKGFLINTNRPFHLSPAHQDHANNISQTKLSSITRTTALSRPPITGLPAPGSVLSQRRSPT